MRNMRDEEKSQKRKGDYFWGLEGAKLVAERKRRALARESARKELKIQQELQAAKLQAALQDS